MGDEQVEESEVVEAIESKLSRTDLKVTGRQIKYKYHRWSTKDEIRFIQSIPKFCTHYNKTQLGYISPQEIIANYIKHTKVRRWDEGSNINVHECINSAKELLKDFTGPVSVN